MVQAKFDVAKYLSVLDSEYVHLKKTILVGDQLVSLRSALSGDELEPQSLEPIYVPFTGCLGYFWLRSWFSFWSVLWM